MFGVDDSIYVCATAGGIITRVALYLGVGIQRNCDGYYTRYLVYVKFVYKSTTSVAPALLISDSVGRACGNAH
jgi:hypothetical protein